jgi:hypothetical protein
LRFTHIVFGSSSEFVSISLECVGVMLLTDLGVKRCRPCTVNIGGKKAVNPGANIIKSNAASSRNLRGTVCMSFSLNSIAASMAMTATSFCTGRHERVYVTAVICEM